MFPKISPALLVSLATLGGYVTAFVQELGYTEHFGVPAQLITISLTHILIATSAVIVVAALLFTLFETTKSLFVPVRQAVMRRLVLFLTLFMLIGTMAQLDQRQDSYRHWVELGLLVAYFLI